jgi:hypothetical protein
LHRNCLLKRVVEKKLEGRIKMIGRRGWGRRQLLDDLKEKRRYLKLKAEALDRTLWRTRFGRGYGPVVRQTTEWVTGKCLCCRKCSYYYYPKITIEWFVCVFCSWQLQGSILSFETVCNEAGFRDIMLLGIGILNRWRVCHDSADPEISNVYVICASYRGHTSEKNSWHFVSMFILTEIGTNLKNETESCYSLLKWRYS